MTKEPQLNDLRQKLFHSIQGILSYLKALRTRAIGWAQPLYPQYRKLLLGVGLSVVLIVVILTVWKIPQRQLGPLKAKIQRERNSLQPQERLKLEHDARKLENDARTTLVQTLGGAALLIGLYFTAKTLRTTQEGQITDRFTKAINQLGEPGREKLATRLGGIYALERIARDSEQDYWPIMEILTAYVRVHAPITAEPSPKEDALPSEEPLPLISIGPLQPPTDNQPIPNEPPPIIRMSPPPMPIFRTSPPLPAADIQAILTVLGRRARSRGKGERQPLNLAYTDLRWAHLESAHLEGAFLRGAHLQGADLTSAHLEGADLRGAHLEGVPDFSGAALACVKTLYWTHLDPPLLEQIQRQYPHLLRDPRLCS